MTSVLLLACVLAAGEREASIDALLEQTWRQQGIEPAAVCSDETFLRRVTLDLAGRIPTPAEVEAFRRSPDRARTIDTLLQSEAFPRFWSEVWAAALNGYTDAFDADRELLRRWLEEGFREDRGYDRMVAELITARGPSGYDGPANFLVRHPRDPVVKICRMFLGVRLDCARCHDHPFDRWTQEDFARMRRFFDATRREEVAEGSVRLVDAIPGDGDERPRFLSGARPLTSRWRSEFALFVTRSKPFARTFANRVWYHLMGRGIVHPPDDFHAQQEPAVPGLLEYLAKQGAAQGFAVKPMVRLICNSRAYQRSSESRGRDTGQAKRFAYRILKPLTPEQTIDSVAVALDMPLDPLDRRRFVRRLTGESLDEDYSATWEYRETVQSLLTRLNLDVRVPENSVERLYLRILSRAPTDRERQLTRDRRAADLVYALLNSNEFFFNH